MGTSARIDVLVYFQCGKATGFELKAKNKKNPQTGKYALCQGIGQALLYQDALSASRNMFCPVFLTSDQVDADIAALVVRNRSFIGLMEANPDRIVCFAGRT